MIIEGEWIPGVRDLARTGIISLALLGAGCTEIRPGVITPVGDISPLTEDLVGNQFEVVGTLSTEPREVNWSEEKLTFDALAKKFVLKRYTERYEIYTLTDTLGNSIKVCPSSRYEDLEGGEIWAKGYVGDRYLEKGDGDRSEETLLCLVPWYLESKAEAFAATATP